MPSLVEIGSVVLEKKIFEILFIYFRFFVIISSRTSLFLTLLRNGTLKCFSQKQPFFQQFQKQHKTHPYKTSTLVMELDVLINIIHTKLRHNCILDYDLFRKNKIESTKFAYGLPEDSYLFFFVCTNYTLARNDLFRCLLHSTQLPIIDCHLLLWGDEAQNDNKNKHIFSSVQKNY